MGVTQAEVVYDLGSVLRIDRLALWHEDGSGFGTARISISNDGISFASLVSISPVDLPLGADYGVQVFSLGEVDARYVRFDITGCPQEPSFFNGCAIGQMAFSMMSAPQVPEPASLALLGIGLAGLSLSRRRA